jgi:hypothetical protein
MFIDAASYTNHGSLGRQPTAISSSPISQRRVHGLPLCSKISVYDVQYGTCGSRVEIHEHATWSDAAIRRFERTWPDASARRSAGPCVDAVIRYSRTDMVEEGEREINPRSSFLFSSGMSALA